MRQFAVLGHRTDAHSTWSLNDLPGSGRADVLIRNVTAALLDSHGIRSDVEVILHLMAGAGTGRRLRINGSDLRGCNLMSRSPAVCWSDHDSIGSPNTPSRALGGGTAGARSRRRWVGSDVGRVVPTSDASVCWMLEANQWVDWK